MFASSAARVESLIFRANSRARLDEPLCLRIRVESYLEAELNMKLPRTTSQSLQRAWSSGYLEDLTAFRSRLAMIL